MVVCALPPTELHAQVQSEVHAELHAELHAGLYRRGQQYTADESPQDQVKSRLFIAPRFRGHEIECPGHYDLDVLSHHSDPADTARVQSQNQREEKIFQTNHCRIIVEPFMIAD